jgi:hypothetical protein
MQEASPDADGCGMGKRTGGMGKRSLPVETTLASPITGKLRLSMPPPQGLTGGAGKVTGAGRAGARPQARGVTRGGMRKRTGWHG